MLANVKTAACAAFVELGRHADRRAPVFELIVLVRRSRRAGACRAKGQFDWVLSHIDLDEVYEG
jgi:hypothetical protein